jgi:hypothetical protein
MVTNRRIWVEIWLLLALSLGRSGVYSIVELIGRLTAGTPLADQTVALHPVQSPRPYLDLTYQLLSIVFALVPVALAIYFLNTRYSETSTDPRSTRESIGLGLRNRGECGNPLDSATAPISSAQSDPSRALKDIGWGALIFAAIGIPGLAFYLFGRATGLTVAVQAGQQASFWWTIPILLLSALKSGIQEEVIVVAYLFERTKDLGWSRKLLPSGTAALDWRFIAFSALLRGSYHLYQGIGPFIGNVVMGIAFAWWYRSRWGHNRIIPLIIAHTLLDTVAFLGSGYLPV